MSILTTSWTLKSGASLDGTHPKLIQVISSLAFLWTSFFPEDIDGLTITSGSELDGKHDANSRHYAANCDSGFSEAIDIRLNDVKAEKATHFCTIAFIILTFQHGFIFTFFTEKLLTPTSHLHVQLKHNL